MEILQSGEALWTSPGYLAAMPCANRSGKQGGPDDDPPEPPPEVGSWQAPIHQATC
jgi:hypothetical protein